MTLTAKLEARLQRVLAEAREVLAPMLEEPFYVAESFAAWGDSPPLDAWQGRGGAWGPVPALFLMPDGSWWGAGMTGHVEREATCGEALALLEKHAPDVRRVLLNVAEYEARAMTLAGELLMPDAEERAAWLERTVKAWPWTRVTGLGSVPDILPMLVTNLADLVLVVSGAGRRARLSAEASDLTLWIVEALEQRWPGAGTEYRARRAEGYPEQVTVTRESGAPGDLVSGEQLEALYRTLPPVVLHARALRRDVEHIASGDEPRSRLERVAKLALAEAKAEASEDACDKLAGALRRTVEKLRPILRLDALPPTTEREALALLDTINGAFADYVAPMGDGGKKLAASVREASAARANASADERWKLWRSEPGREPRWLVELAVVVWCSEAERETNARDFSLSVVHAGGDRYVKQPKVVPAISWAMGAPGMSTVELEGDRYAPEPGVAARLVPRSFALLSEIKGHERRPHQTVLALEREDDSTALAVAVAGATNYAISPLAAKYALLILASEEVRTGKPQRSTLGRFAAEAYPDTRIQPRELRASALALDELRRLFVYLPNGAKVQVFDTTSAAAPEYALKDLPIVSGLTRSFAVALAGGLSGGALRGNEYNGDFLVNLDGAMRLPTKRPATLRHYIRAAAHWNAAFKPGGAFDPGKLPAYTARKWASMTNSIPPAAVAYLLADGKRKRTTSTGAAQWSKDRKAMLDDLDFLHAEGLVVVEKVGKDGLRLLPPAVHLEAWAKARKEGSRPDHE